MLSFLAFSIEQLQTTQNCTKAMLDFPVCIPSKRIRFTMPDGTPGNSPTHASAFIYLPGKVNITSSFYKVFAKFGSVILPYNFYQSYYSYISNQDWIKTTTETTTMNGYAFFADYDSHAESLDEVDYQESETCPNGFCPVSEEQLALLSEDELVF